MQTSIELAVINAVRALLENQIALSRCQEGSLVLHPEFLKQFPETLTIVESRVHCEQAKELLDTVVASFPKGE